MQIISNMVCSIILLSVCAVIIAYAYKIIREIIKR